MIEGFREMWLVVMFDLPTDTRKDRRAYTDFRKYLLQDGFEQLQYSVYKRYCSSRENAEAHVGRVSGNLPDKGEVRILQVTEKQFEKMLVFWGRRPRQAEPAPEQLTLF
jgi:CRISPR-associated protein Cas2